MTKKSKLIIAGSTVLAGSIITAIAVPLSQKANQPTPEQEQEQQVDSQKPNEPTPEQEQEQEKTPPLTEENKGQVDSQKDSTKKEEQQSGAESGSGEKTEEDSAQAETKPQVDPQKNNTKEEQQSGAESGSGEKTEEDSAQAETKPQVDPQKNNTKEEQQSGAESGSDQKTEEDSAQAETKPQVDPQKNNTKEEQQSGAESGSDQKTEENNKVTEPMESQVDSQNNGTENQQNNGEVGEKVEDSSAVESSEQKVTELQSQLTPVNLYFRDKYFYLRLRTSKETFEKIKQNRLKFILEKGLREYIEQASGITQSNHTAYYLNYSDEHNGNVSFEITSEQSYGSEQEKGQYKVTKVWLSNDTSEKNLLNKESNPVDVK